MESTGYDLHVGTSASIPAEFGRLKIRMRVTGGPATDIGQVFFGTDERPDHTEAASLIFDLEVETSVTVEVFNLSGRLVDRPIVGERMSAGRVNWVWTPDQLSSGAYYLRATLGTETAAQKLIWLGSQ